MPVVYMLFFVLPSFAILPDPELSTPTMKEGEDSPPSSAATSAKDTEVMPGKLVEIADSDLERKAVRKLDYTILPVMTMFYLLSFLVCDPPVRLRKIKD